MFTTSECGNSNFLMIMRGGGDDHALYVLVLKQILIIIVAGGLGVLALGALHGSVVIGYRHQWRAGQLREVAGDLAPVRTVAHQTDLDRRRGIIGAARGIFTFAFLCARFRACIIAAIAASKPPAEEIKSRRLKSCLFSLMGKGRVFCCFHR